MYKKQPVGWLKHLDFLLIDLICFHLAFWGSHIIRHGWVNPWEIIMYRNFDVVTSIILIFVVAWTNTFSGVLRRGYYREIINAAKTVFFVMLLSVLYLFAIQQGGDFSRLVLAGSAIGYFFLACIFRNLWKLLLRKRYSRSGKMHRLVLITTADRVETVIKNIIEQGIPESKLDGVLLVDSDDIAQEPYHTEGYLQDEQRAERRTPGKTPRYREINGIPVKATGEGIIPYLIRGWTDEVFLDLDESDPEYRELSDRLMEMGMVIHRRLGESGEYLGRDKVMQYVGGYPVVTVGMKILSPRQAFAKRAVDIVFGIVGCIATVLLTVVIGPIIYIKSPGNIFFSQIRIGRNGKPFRMYKFRSMYPDAEAKKSELADQNSHKDGMMFKLDYDPRIIGSKTKPGRGIGYFIRKTSLDEFPQFFNVLIGNMSFVGTRPPTQDEWERYEAHHRSRLTIKPGITGLWQVSGRSEITDFEEVLRLDREYIEKWSMKLDVQIVLRTVGAVSKGKGAK